MNQYGVVTSGYTYVEPVLYTAACSCFNCYNKESDVSKFEQAFKIAQLMVDRSPVKANDLKAFLALVEEIEKAL